MSIDLFKRITDVYPMTVPIKGGSVSWNCETIVLTSNNPLEWWWDTSFADLEAVKRRVKVFKYPEDRDEAYRFLGGEAPVPPAEAPEPEVVDLTLEALNSNVW